MILLKSLSVRFLRKYQKKSLLLSLFLPKFPAKKAKKITKKLRLEGEKEVGDLREPGARRTAKPKMDIIADDIDMDLLIGDANVITRLPPKENKVLIRANAYYMNNR